MIEVYDELFYREVNKYIRIKKCLLRIFGIRLLNDAFDSYG